MSKDKSILPTQPMQFESIAIDSEASSLNDLESALGPSPTPFSRTGEPDTLGPILSDILSLVPPKAIQPLRSTLATYNKWIRRIIIVRMVFSAVTNPSRVSGIISGVLALCLGHLWSGGQEWRRRAADSALSVMVVTAAYIKSDPVTFQLLLGDFYRDRETDARQVDGNTSTPYRAPLAYCLEPYTSPLAFCYDPVIFIPAMFMVYRRLARYFVCPGLEGRVIDGMSILTALFTIWVLFPEFSWSYALNGRPWTVREIHYDELLAGA
ncbi:hypothetical protein TWF281_001531 [Arthrobotrys megalospora]